MSDLKNAAGEDENDFLDLYIKLSPPFSGERQKNLTYWCTLVVEGVGPGGVVQHGGEVGRNLSDRNMCSMRYAVGEDEDDFLDLNL